MNVAREVKPPVLSVDPSSVVFVDRSSNNAIDAGEEDAIRFEVENTGFGAGLNCVAKVTVSGTTRDIKVSDVKIPTVGIGQKVPVTIPLQAGMNTADGLLTVSVSVEEPNGFGVDQFSVDVATKSFVAPMLRITDYSVTGTAGTLQRKSKFDLQLLLQNTEYGNARDVTVSVTFPEGIFVLDGEQTQRYSILGAGETKSLDFSLIANNNYSQSTIPVKVSINEKYGRFSEDREIELAFNQTLSDSRISISESAAAPREDIRIATIGSDVDKVPVSGRVSDKTFAIIIANENYQNDASVEYAHHDGKVFKEYCTKTLGIPESNIRLSMDATLNNIRGSVSWIKSVAAAYNGEARIIFYYSGHGLPDDATRSAYILPVDGDGRTPKATGFSVDALYKELASCRTASTLVLMDACFSGARKDGGMLVAAKGVVIAPEETDPYGYVVVLSAATGEQTAFKFDEQGHGMFTYYLLKGLKESNGDISLGALSDYVIDNVRRKPIVVNSKTQTPTVLTGADMAGSWRTPTAAEWQELYYNCNWEWTRISGLKGYKVTSKKTGYTDRWIFLPAAGYRYGSGLSSVGSDGNYWSSSLDSSYSSRAYGCCWFLSDLVDPRYCGSRCCGHSVRPVCD